MKKFLYKFLLFISPIFLLGYFLDVVLSTQLKKSNLYAEEEYPTWNAVFDGKVDSDILIFGSSRAWKHIDPTMMGQKLHNSTFNLGIDGHNFWLQYFRYQQLLKKNKRPKYIILSLDYFTLKKNKELYNLEQFLPYMLWNDEMKDATMSYHGFSFMDFKIPLLRYYGKFDAIKAVFSLPKNPITRVRGYEGRDEVWNSDFDIAKSKMKNLYVGLDSATIVLFDKFLKESKKENIHLIFVYTPEYIEGQQFVKNRKQIMNLFKNFSSKYSIPFYDYSGDPICYQRKYFYNATHLNKTGSEVFTQKFSDTLQKAAIIEQSPKKGLSDFIKQ